MSVRPSILEDRAARPVTNGTKRAAPPPIPVPPPRLYSEVVLVTPEQAANWLTDCHFKPQRKLDTSRVEELAAAIRAGEFETTAIKFHRCGGRDYLTDGQHRLWSIVEADQPAELVVVRETVDSLEQVGAAYGRIDTGKIRTPAESMAATGMLELTGLNITQLNRTWSAVRVVMNGFMGTTNSANRWELRIRSRIMRGVMHFKGEAREYFDCIAAASETHRNRLSTAAVMSVGLVTFRYRPEQAREFWTLVAERDGLEAKKGPWKLVEYVTENPLRQVNDASRRVAACWNAFRDGDRKLEKILVRSVSIPINIDGTPYNTTRIIRHTFDGGETE